MDKNINYDYDENLDALHIYSSDIKEGVKGSISFGYSIIDISFNNKVVGVEIGEASKIFQISPEILSNLDTIDLKTIKVGNVLLIGVNLAKGEIKTNFQLNFPIQKTPLLVPN